MLLKLLHSFYSTRCDGIGSTDLLHLAQGLTNNCHLEELNISHNELDDAGCFITEFNRSLQVSE